VVIKKFPFPVVTKVQQTYNMPALLMDAGKMEMDVQTCE